MIEERESTGCVPKTFMVPIVLLFIVLTGLYMYFTGEAGEAKWYI